MKKEHKEVLQALKNLGASDSQYLAIVALEQENKELLEGLKELLKDYQNLAGSPEFGDLPEVARAVEVIKKATK